MPEKARNPLEYAVCDSTNGLVPTLRLDKGVAISLYIKHFVERSSDSSHHYFFELDISCATTVLAPGVDVSVAATAIATLFGLFIDFYFFIDQSYYLFIDGSIY